jgi:hypothetical protein
MNHIGSILTDRPNALTQQPGQQPAATNQQNYQPTMAQPPMQHTSPMPETTQNLTTPVISQPTIDVPQLQKMIAQMKSQLDIMQQMLQGQTTTTPLQTISPEITNTMQAAPSLAFTEGVFNGTAMIGSDGKEYPISPNYASKSKLVEGDLMKMTTNLSGMLRFKQIGPIARKHVSGQVMFDTNTNEWTVLAEGRVYKILQAAITFHKAEQDDMVTIVVPEDGESAWAAIERNNNK